MAMIRSTLSFNSIRDLQGMLHDQARQHRANLDGHGQKHADLSNSVKDLQATLAEHARMHGDNFDVHGKKHAELQCTVKDIQEALAEVRRQHPEMMKTSMADHSRQHELALQDHADR